MELAEACYNYRSTKISGKRWTRMRFQTTMNVITGVPLRELRSLRSTQLEVISAEIAKFS
jgi:hypothetical protein